MVSVLCLFVDMKRLQNETSRISTDLIRNLKIKIISISVFYWYFFEIFKFHIESYLIDIKSKSNLIVFCLNFSISPMPDWDTFSHVALCLHVMLLHLASFTPLGIKNCDFDTLIERKTLGFW